MKIFLAYKFTGEIPKELTKILGQLKKILESQGHFVFCSLWKEDYFRENNFTNKQILKHSLKEIKRSDIFLALVKSDEKSEGLLLEAGYAMAQDKKIVLLIKRDIPTVFLSEAADQIIEFSDLSELDDKLVIS